MAGHRSVGGVAGPVDVWREVTLRGSIEKWKDSFQHIPVVCAKCKPGLLGFAECLLLAVVPEENGGGFPLLPVTSPENSISCLGTWALACLHGTHISDLFCFGGVVVVRVGPSISLGHHMLFRLAVWYEIPCSARDQPRPPGCHPEIVRATWCRGLNQCQLYARPVP